MVVAPTKPAGARHYHATAEKVTAPLPLSVPRKPETPPCRATPAHSAGNPGACAAPRTCMSGSRAGALVPGEPPVPDEKPDAESRHADWQREPAEPCQLGPQHPGDGDEGHERIRQDEHED